MTIRNLTRGKNQRESLWKLTTDNNLHSSFLNFNPYFLSLLETKRIIKKNLLAQTVSKAQRK